ncbi:ribosomal-protein-alanine N-acetyltransferase [Chitinophaga niastensis]|uniref:Ribosomal-protein-alanine N-acetyltransferase n=1 Tax=Chitinophaga niastensis TaxID=536980 RepID=A0A2P8HQ07_CHINA|nr:GNAT family N-acetyltransferase [Chitinophaga niastensis]PSL48287.1 ribosomal-protein-alanine N-acetyltransferase [Chitinophaga niastensis]
MIETNFTPFPILTTDRLVLRQLETTDDKDIFSHRSDDSVNTYLEDFRHSSIEQTQAFIDRVQKEIAIGKTILWVITQKGRNKFIGTICLWNISKDEYKAETGYTLDPEFHRMGYMNEALVKVIDFGFNKMKLITIEAYVHENNDSSIQLLLRNKFKQGAAPKKAVGNNRIFFSLTSEIV